MSRGWIAMLILAATALAQQTQPQEPAPPEEDESLVVKEYTFNPLQAAKELKIGSYYWKKGSYRAAALRFEEATKWDGTLAEAFLRLGEARDKLRDTKAATAAYTKYLELAPDAKNAAEIKRRVEKATGAASPRAASQ